MADYPNYKLKNPHRSFDYGVHKTVNGYRPWFRIGNQSFEMIEFDEKEEADWYIKQFRGAFMGFMEQVSFKTEE